MFSVLCSRRGHCGLIGLPVFGLVLVVALLSAPAAPASEPGMRAANEVQQANYYDLMDLYLYTHTGHNRGINGPHHDPARDNIKALFESYGLPAVFETFTYQSNTQENVVATQLGTLYPNEEYIIGAHYDSVSNPGADDNASGVALVLEAARVLSQYESAYTIRYIAFDAEEVGLIGSQRYVAAHPGALIRGMISADMVAYDPNNLAKVNIYGRTASNPIKQALAAAVDEYGENLIPTIKGASSGSDHYPFEQAGYQACLLIEGTFNSANYHSQRDNFEQPGNLNFAFATKMTRSVVGWLVDQAGVQVFVTGDLNCDNAVDFDDINPFVLALSDPAGYQAAFPNCRIMNGDVNGDGVFDFDDINPFVALLSAEMIATWE